MTPSSSVTNFLKSLKEMTPSSSGSLKKMIPSSNIVNIILIFREQEERKAMIEAVKQVSDSLGLDVNLESFSCPWKALLHTGVMAFHCCIEHELMLPTRVDAVLADDCNYETFSLMVETYDYRSWLVDTEAHHFSSREAKCLVKRMEVVSPRSVQNMFYNKLYQDSAAKEYLMDRLRYILDPSRERMGHWSILRNDPTRESLKIRYTQQDLIDVMEKRACWFADKLEGLEIDGDVEDPDLGGLGSLGLLNQAYGGGDEGSDQE